MLQMTLLSPLMKSWKALCAAWIALMRATWVTCLPISRKWPASWGRKCSLGRLLTACRNLPAESLEALVDSLLAEIPEDVGSNAVIAVKSENAPASPVNGQKSQKKPVYDPAMVYILEFCTVLALRDASTVELLGQRVVGALQAVLRDASSYHPILVARATFYLFRLLQFSYV